MKSKLAYAPSALLLFLLVQLTACTKVDWEDYIHPDKTPKYCDIKKIQSYREWDVDTLTWDFYYNKKGNPTNIELSNVGTGRPEFLFYYDKNHRLTDFIGNYENGHFEVWHHYAYEGNKIVRDTARFFGMMVNGQPVNDPIYQGGNRIHYIEYDSYDRIIKINTIYPYITTGPPPQQELFTYNPQGNLSHYKSFYPSINSIIQETYYTNYDNKVNLHRTNKLWMFIDRNYSLNNNVSGPTFYNSYGLPIKLNSEAGFNAYRFLYGDRDIADSDIQYNCK